MAPPPPESKGNSPKGPPIKLEDWKKQIEDLLNGNDPVEPVPNAKDCLKGLLGQEVASKGNEFLDDTFSQLFSLALTKRPNFASAFIDSRYFKYDNAENAKKSTALHEAVRHGNIQAAEKIVRQHRDAVNQRDITSWTPLHYAATLDPKSASPKDLIKLLLNHGADINAADTYNTTPLHAACLNADRLEAVKELLSNNAEVNTRDIFGDSPLHDAANSSQFSAGESYTKLLRVLIEHGADVEYRNFNDKTAQDLLPLAVSPNVPGLFDLSVERLAKKRSHPIPLMRPRCWEGESDGDPDDNQSSGTSDSELSTDVCKKFFAYIHFFYGTSKHQFSWAQSVSIHSLLHKNEATMETLVNNFVSLAQVELPVSASDIRNNFWKWIHIPVNQMSWVTDLVWCLTRESGVVENDSRKHAWDFLERNIAQRRNANPKSFTRVPHAGDLKGLTTSVTENGLAAPVLSSVEPYFGKENERTVLHRREIWRNKTQHEEDQRISIVVPYLDFESEPYLRRYEDPPMNETDTLRFRNMRRLERQSSTYNGLSGLFSAQTLDQSYYDMLTKEELKVRDLDQVVFKYQESLKKGASLKLKDIPKSRLNMAEEPAGSKKKSGKALDIARIFKDANKLLMVNQLWLWKLDKGTVITAFPDRYHRGTEDTLLETIRQGDIASYKRPEQLVENILFECATFPEEFWYAGLERHVLDIFETFLAKRSDEEAACFKAFCEAPPSKKRELAQQIDTETKAIHDVKDVCDELHLLLHLFETQYQVVQEFAYVFWPEDSLANYRGAFVHDCGLEKLIKRAKRLDERAQRTLDNLDYFVQMKQTQNSLDETRASGRLNNYIMLFTLVTVVFTPLSFMTSLFAIPFASYPRSGDNIALSSQWVSDRMVTGEFVTLGAIFAIALVVFVFQRIQKDNGKIGEMWTQKRTQDSKSRDYEYTARSKRRGLHLRRPFSRTDGDDIEKACDSE